MRPLHASYMKTGSPAEVRPLQASLILSLCALLGWCFLIRSALWVSIWAPKGLVWLSLYNSAWEEQVRPLQPSYLKTGSLAEVRPLQASLVILLCALSGWCFLIRLSLWYQYELLKGQCVYGLYSFASAEQVRPLHASYLQTRSLGEVRPL